MSSLAEILGKGVPANVRATEGAGTTTLTRDDNRTQIFTLSANRSVTLPSTGVKAGEIWTFQNKSAFTLSFAASDTSSLTVANGNNLDPTIYNGRVILLALADNPSNCTQWRILHVVETTVPHSTTWTFGNGGTGTISGRTVYFSRVNNSVRVALPASLQGTASSAPADLSADTAFPVRFRSDSAAGDGGFFAVRSAGAYPTAPGFARFTSTGSILLKKDASGAAWGAGTSGVSDLITDDHSIVYESAGSL